MFTVSLFKAMVSTSFHAFLRPGEMAKSRNSLKQKDIKLKSSGFCITFRKFKHHHGDPVKLKVKASSSDCCPVAILHSYAMLRGVGSGNLFL